jgi:hypothetical protein
VEVQLKKSKCTYEGIKLALKGGQTPCFAFLPCVSAHLFQLAVLAQKQLLKLVSPLLAVLQCFPGGVKSVQLGPHL